MKKTKLLFKNELPELPDLGEELLLIYDEVLVKKSVQFRKWTKKFALSYSVKSGESLKSIENFPSHMEKIVRICEGASSRKFTIVAVGGGSVGDFAGFVASILKRGVGLVHVPSTWLAALDSAHGGKTALNVSSAKNQVGTFYPAQKVVLVRSLLMSQPDARVFEGFGELVKMALIAGGSFWKNLAKEKKLLPDLLWRYLPLAIKAKYKVVEQDPEEKSGVRHVLNLGHTLGHVLESYYDLPHGIAVNYGLDFALKWSLQLKIMTGAEYAQVMKSPVMGYLLSPVRDHLLKTNSVKLTEFRRLLLSDKKKTQAGVLRFVFVKSPGNCSIREIHVDDVLIEICRQQEDEFYV